ncbi:MAG TPA: UPF0182 family protein [Acidimicrobiales bacterium]|nr:UPF0182 family protein [Acidimicrobiales bacterium]
MRRPPVDVPPSRPRRDPRRRIGLVAIVAVLFVLFTSLKGIAGFYTDYLWFGEVGFRQVWRTTLGAKVLLSVLFTVGAFLLVWLNLLIADHIAPVFRPAGPEDEIVARYQEVVGPYAGKIRVVVAVLFALIAGTGAASQWRDWLLFRNSVAFGTKDPLFHKDVSFYTFRLPFLGDVLDWLFVSLVLVLVLTVVAHYLNGGIRLQSPVQRVSAQVKVHISVLLALLALTKAATYWIDRFNLVLSGDGYVQGAGYTDVHARLPAKNLLVLIMLAAAVLFLVNIRQRGWALPVIGVLTWGVVALVAGVIYPAFIQNVKVNPAEAAKERPYIVHNIDATRAALNLGGVNESDYNYTDQLSGQALIANAGTISNVRLWDPDTLKDTYQNLQEIRRYYQFTDVDIDRYQVQGQTRQVVLSTRGLNPSDIPGNSWVNRHLQYTHGYGAVLSPANAVDPQGRPDYLVSDIPPVVADGGPQIEEPRVYFSEDLPGFAIANSKTPEIDYQSLQGEDKTSSYQGKGGVTLSSFMRRAAFFLRFSDFNILVSSEITPQSRILFNRDIQTRVRSIAPFLSYDSDPYPVVAGGRIFWVQDAYTTSDRYPYAQTVRSDGLRAGAELGGKSFNYIRNSVKVTIDAYSGEVRFFVFDAEDPIVKTWSKAFPGMFLPGTDAPTELRDHVRYPEDLFRLQANMFGTYHVTDPGTFYRGTDAWDLAQDPGTGRVSDTLQQAVTTPATVPGQGGVQIPVVSSKTRRMDPTYLLLRLPNEKDLSFLVLQPFVAASGNDQQKLLTAFLVAKSDRGVYGQMNAYVMPRGEQIDGPLVVNNAIQSDPDISRELSLLDNKGSKALFGQVQLIPIENSILYVRPLYVTSEQTNLPEVKRVIVVFNGRAVMKPSLRESLITLFGDAPATLEQQSSATTGATGGTGSTGGTGATGGTGTVAPGVQALLDQASAALQAADQALANKDLAGYQAKVKEAAGYIDHARAAQAAGGGSANPSGDTTTTTAPAGSSTTSSTTTTTPST